jgi:hypothetical protein
VFDKSGAAWIAAMAVTLGLAGHLLLSATLWLRRAEE